VTAPHRADLPMNDPIDRLSAYEMPVLPVTAEDRDRARLAVASAAVDVADAALLLAALGLDGPELADHLTRRRRTT
jgi:hypothetical protein